MVSSYNLCFLVMWLPFLFLFDLFSEFTSELRLFFKLVTLISFFCCFIFRVYEAVRERKHGYPQWKYVSKPTVL